MYTQKHLKILSKVCLSFTMLLIIIYHLYPGSHITPVIRYVDDISFQVLSGDDESCRIKGNSFSTVSSDCVLDITLLVFLYRALPGTTTPPTTAT
jgi:hypothetical protein